MLEMCLYFIENTNIDHYCKLDDEYAPWKIGNFKQKYSLNLYVDNLNVLFLLLKGSCKWNINLNFLFNLLKFFHSFSLTINYIPRLEGSQNDKILIESNDIITKDNTITFHAEVVKSLKQESPIKQDNSTVPFSLVTVMKCLATSTCNTTVQKKLLPQ